MTVPNSGFASPPSARHKFSRESPAFSATAHPARAGNRTDRDRDGGCVLGFECLIEVSRNHLGTVEIFGCVERLCFGHFSTPASTYVLGREEQSMSFASLEAPHPIPATPTASTDSVITCITNCSDTIGWTRHCESFSANDRLASKNSGS